MGALKLTYNQEKPLLKVVQGTFLSEEKGCAVVYRYGFNGKENDDETGFQDYGMRQYNPKLGRFFSVDPIAHDYPQLTPYQFASNTPIVAIDLDGLEAFFIHGTNNNPKSWAVDNTPLIKNLLKLTNNKTVDLSFGWNVTNAHGQVLSRTTNDTKSRNHAATMLVNHIIDYRKTKGITDEEITLIGFSHGGNVSIQAAQMLYEQYGIKVNIITVNTPAFNGNDDAENPAMNEGINDMIHFYTKGDGVAGPGAGAGTSDDKYTDTPLYMNSQQQYLVIPKAEASNNFISKHFLKNVNPDSKEIKGARKLSVIWKGERNPENNFRKGTKGGK
jgi:RHS repeat-associated protein